MFSCAGAACGGGWLCIAGMYEPAVELLLLEQDFAGGAAAWKFNRLCRLQKELLATSLFTSAEATSAASDVPESILLVKPALQQSNVQVLHQRLDDE